MTTILPLACCLDALCRRGRLWRVVGCAIGSIVLWGQPALARHGRIKPQARAAVQFADASSHTSTPAIVSVNDPDKEIARAHFAAGSKAYEAHDYAQALSEFKLARQVKPHPAFDFNIGRCEDRLEHWAEAIEAYVSYLAATPDAPDAIDIRKRVVMLNERVAHAAPVGVTLASLSVATVASMSESVDRPALFQFWKHRLPTAVAGVAVASLVAGSALLLSAIPDYGKLKVGCAGAGCTDAQIRPLETRVDVSYALLAVGAAAAAADVGLWIWDLKRERHVARLVPAGPGIALLGKF